MENETQEQEVGQAVQKSSLHKVTPFSKYLALALFVILPFLGGWIGYTYAPEKVVEVERVLIKEIEVDPMKNEISGVFSSEPLARQISETVRAMIQNDGSLPNRPNQVVLQDSVEQKTVILFTEDDPDVTLANECEVQCYGIFYLTSDGQLVFGRHKQLDGITATRLLNVVSVPIPEEYLNQNQIDARKGL